MEVAAERESESGLSLGGALVFLGFQKLLSWPVAISEELIS